MRYRRLKLSTYEAVIMRDLALSEYWKVKEERPSGFADACPELHEVYLYFRRLKLMALRRLVKKIDKLLGIDPKASNS